MIVAHAPAPHSLLSLLVQVCQPAHCLGFAPWSPHGWGPPVHAPSRQGTPAPARSWQVPQRSSPWGLGLTPWPLLRLSSWGQWPHSPWRQGSCPRYPLPRKFRPWYSPFRGSWASLGHWWPRSRRESSLT